MHHEEMGFIAQDVEVVLPDTVAEDPVTGTKSLRVDHFTPLLVESVKEQQGMIDGQRSRLDRLEAALARHEVEIAVLTAQLEACGCPHGEA